MQISGISAVILVIFIFLAVQSVGGYLQIKRYQEAVKRVHKLGNVGIGQRRGSLLNAHVAIIACDKEGIITGAEVLDGISVWADFHPVDTFLGKKLVEDESEYVVLVHARLDLRAHLVGRSPYPCRQVLLVHSISYLRWK